MADAERTSYDYISVYVYIEKKKEEKNKPSKNKRTLFCYDSELSGRTKAPLKARDANVKTAVL